MQSNCNCNLLATSNLFLPMKHYTHSLVLAFRASALGALLSVGLSTAEAQTDEEDFVYHVGEESPIAGHGFSIGGFIFPELFITGTGGLFEPGSNPEDYSNSEHDPANEIGIQSIELDLAFLFSDTLSGFVSGAGFQTGDHEWEAELEEAFLSVQINDSISVAGGQFLNEVGFQAHRHTHAWDFVNQNLINGRFLNEGHLITQGGRVTIDSPETGILTLGVGGVRSHSHEEEEEEEHAVEAHGSEFTQFVFTVDHKFQLPSDPSLTIASFLSGGENGIYDETYVFGVGFRKIWNGHNHGSGAPEFCTGAVQLQSEFMKRTVQGLNEDGELFDFDDYGFSTSILYGLTDSIILSLRHDFVSEVEHSEMYATHRISPAITAFFGPDNRIRTRLQYDYVDHEEVGGEHVAWFQVMLYLGGDGTHAGHNH